MADTLTSSQRSKVMSAIRSKGMKPEMAVRQLAHALGYRYQLHRRDLPGTPDLVFPRRRKVIFVHGCFWHSHGCKVGKRSIGTNVDYWSTKLERNRARDTRNLAALECEGWDVLVAWECETKDWEALALRLRWFLDTRCT